MIAIVGAIARRRLRETPEFLEAKRKWLKEGVQQMNIDVDPIGGAKFNATWKEPIRLKTLISYFSVLCGWPLCFYLAFLYFVPFLKENFGYSSTDIIRHNFLLSIVSVIASTVLTYLSSKIHPIKILKFCGVFFLFFMIFLPFLMSSLTSPIQVYVIQALILSVSIGATPADPVFLSHLPLYRRVTYGTFLFAVSRALVNVITSFGLIYLGNHFGHFGLLLISLPITLFYLFGILHFEGLERKRKLYPNLSRK